MNAHPPCPARRRSTLAWAPASHHATSNRLVPPVVSLFPTSAKTNGPLHRMSMCPRCPRQPGGSPHGEDAPARVHIFSFWVGHARKKNGMGTRQDGARNDRLLTPTRALNTSEGGLGGHAHICHPLEQRQGTKPGGRPGRQSTKGACVCTDAHARAARPGGRLNASVFLTSCQNE